MKLIILKERLKEGLNLCDKITQKNLTLPILQTTLFSAKKNFLCLSTTNLESGINWWSLAKTEKEGKICLPTKIINHLIEGLPPKPITLLQENLSLSLECENYKAQLNGINPDDFPIIPQPQNIEPLILNSKIFCQNLTSVYKIPALPSSRPEISGVLVFFQENQIKMTATDSFRLLEKKMFLTDNFNQKISFILPQSAAREIISIFGEEDEIKIYVSPNQVWFESLMPEIKHPKINYTCRLIEGEYPNYEEIIPKKFGTTVQLPKEKFLNQIKAASLFSGKSQEVRLKIETGAGKIKIFSQTSGIGKYESVLGAKITGKELEIAFNWRFLIDGVFELKSDEIIISFTDREGPATITTPEKQDHLYILMPIKSL